MTAGRWLRQVSLRVAMPAEEAVRELLVRATGLTPAVLSQPDKQQSIVSVYWEQGSPVPRLLRAELRDGLEAIAGCGLDIGPGTVAIRRVRRQDWADSWKRHFRTLKITDRLVVRPSWRPAVDERGVAEVVLDPGLSFGTGHHATTSFCLRQLVRLRVRCGQSLLDVGTGSGILAIAGAKLGYGPVRALDFDAEAVRTARANARTNCVGKQVRVAQQDVRALPVVARRRFNVVCANLFIDLLLGQRDRIGARVAEGGVLVLAGILREQFGRVRTTYAAAGWQLERTGRRGEWQSGVFKRAGS